MGIFDDMRGGQFRPGPGITEPSPKSGIRRFWFILKNNFGKLVAVNLLFVLFSLPLVTAPAALCGLSLVLANLVREGNCFLWDDFKEGFMTDFWRRTLAGLPFVLIPGGFIFMYIFQLRGAGFVAVGISALLLFLWGCWLFPLMATAPGNPFAQLSNSLGLCLLQAGRTLRLVFALLLAAPLVLFWQALSPVTVLVGISVVALAAQVALAPALWHANPDDQDKRSKP